MRSTRTETLCLESLAKGDALQASSEGALNHQSGRGRMHAPLGHNRPLPDPISCLKMAVNDRWRGGARSLRVGGAGRSVCANNNRRREVIC